MSDDKLKSIPQLGTVPPPAGESDAYNAPTKVGPMAAQIAELINAATVEAERVHGPLVTPSEPPPEEGARPTVAPATYDAVEDESRLASEEAAAAEDEEAEEPAAAVAAAAEEEEAVVAAPEPVEAEPGPASTPVSYSDPIAHTRPEWSSVSKSEPKIPVAARPNRMPILVGILVVVFGILGVAFLIFGHR